MTAPYATVHTPPTALVGDRLFRGNRTEILLIEHPTYGRCAQKRLLAFCDVQSERARIRGEATLQMQAHQLGVVPVLGHDSASLYRHYVPGLTLAQWVERKPKTIPPAQALSIIGSLCQTVAGLHQPPLVRAPALHLPAPRLAIVHRDITPSNVYLDQHLVLLSDFGLAFAGEPPRPSEFLQGSPRFLPPELLAGHAPGPAGDVYQVALLLAWLIQEQLRRFTPASLHGSPVGQQWACAQAWHEPARQALKAHRCDGALDPNPRARPSAQELCSLLNS